jgi:hypothetical protein
MYPAGVIAYHNTATGIAARSDKPYSNVHFRNNLFLPSDDADLATLGMYSYTSYSTFDYNGYRYRKPFIRWYAPTQSVDFSKDHQTMEFETLEAFAEVTGQEKHGSIVDYDIFENAKAPAFREFVKQKEHLGMLFPVYHPEHLDLRLKMNSVAVDAGCRLPSVNDGFIGEQPDLGAYEYGEPLPIYGPRKGLGKIKEVHIRQEE